MRIRAWATAMAAAGMCAWFHKASVLRVRRSVEPHKVSGLVAWLCLLCTGIAAQKASVTASVDPFIGAIETIKHSMGSMDCVAVSGAEAKLVKRIGSAFLISESGDFVTAAHVLAAIQKEDDPCPTSVITLPVGNWQPGAPTEDMVWFPFKNSDCKIDSRNDVAECRLSGDLPARIRKLHVEAVRFVWDIPPDGTQIAFTGFPLEARDPMTFRAHVAAYRVIFPDELTPELVLDHASLPGFSGAPVFLADGTVVAILLKDGKPQAEGMSIARPVSAVREMLRKTPER